MLFTGPDLLPNLIGVINRFREGKHFITADIEGMYMQVSVNPGDRKILRYLCGAEEPEFSSTLDSSLKPIVLLLCTILRIENLCRRQCLKLLP